MTFRVVVTRTAARQLAERLPESAATACVQFLFGPLADDPHRVGAPLRAPFTGQWRARRGEYRVRYRIDDSTRVVYVLDIDHRRDAYRSRTVGRSLSGTVRPRQALVWPPPDAGARMAALRPLACQRGCTRQPASALPQDVRQRPGPHGVPARRPRRDDPLRPPEATKRVPGLDRLEQEQLRQQPIDGESLELGYHVLPRHQGKGFATEAAQAAKDFARRRDVGFVIAIAAPENTASIRVAEKAGLGLWKHADYHGREHLICRADLMAT